MTHFQGGCGGQGEAQVVPGIKERAGQMAALMEVQPCGHTEVAAALMAPGPPQLSSVMRQRENSSSKPSLLLGDSFVLTVVVAETLEEPQNWIFKVMS